MREVEESVTRTVDRRALVDACAVALTALGRGEAVQGEKQLLPTPDGGFFLSLSAVVPSMGWAVAKWASYRPAAIGSGASTSVILASPAGGGDPVAMLRGMTPTHVRTAAATVALLERLDVISRDAHVALIGFGDTNRAVADAIVALHGVQRWTVRTRSASTATLARATLTGEVTAGRGVPLADCDVVISATGATAAVADTDELSPDAITVSLDGRKPWRIGDATTVLTDHASAGVPGDVAGLFAGESSRPVGRVFVDQAGSAVTDVALAAVVLGAGSER